MKIRGILLSTLLAALLTAGVVTAAPAFATAPTITSFTPTSGGIGTVVTITGSAFASPATVKFGGATATTVTVASTTTIKATVPNTASTGPITVTTSAGTATSSTTFTVNASLALSATAGPPTSKRTVYIAGFGPNEAVDIYLDTTDLALISATSTGTGNATLTIPAGATPGSHTITAVGRHSGNSAQTTFIVRTDWPQEGYNAAGIGTNHFENVLSPSTVGQLTRQWRLPSVCLDGSPTVVGGIIYLATCDGALDTVVAATGALKWSVTLGSATGDTSPAVVAGVVYVAVGGALFARSAATGAALWSDALTTGTLTTPLVTGSQIYVGADNGTLYDIGTDGTIEWGANTGSGLVSTPAYGDGDVYVTTLGGTLVGVDATSGLVDFTTTVDNDPIRGAPLFADGIVYVAGDDAYAFNASNGTLRWQSSALWLPATSAPAIDNGTLFVYDGQYAWAFDAGDGTQEWKQYLPSGGPSGPVHAANGVVYAEETSYTFALAESTGARLRTLPSGGDYSGALIADGTVTVGSIQGSSESLARYALPTATSSARPDPTRLRPNPHLHRQD